MFEYLGVLIAVILGLALTHLVRGLAKLIHARRTAKIWWPHVLWTINSMIFVLALWWGMFWWNNLRQWTILEFFFIASYSTILFLLAAILYPPEFPEQMDCGQYFLDNKNWFFAIQIIAWLLDVPETLAKSVSRLRDVPPQYIAYIPIMLAICVIGLASKSRRVQALLPVAWLAATLSYLTLTSLDTITVQR